MSRSEWASSSSFQPVNADSLVNNPPCVEAVLYRWRVKSLVRIRRLLPGNQYRLLHIELHIDFKWFLWAEWQVDCGGQVEVEVDCGGQHNWCIRPAQTRRLDLSAVVSFR